MSGGEGGSSTLAAGLLQGLQVILILSALRTLFVDLLWIDPRNEYDLVRKSPEICDARETLTVPPHLTAIFLVTVALFESVY